MRGTRRRYPTRSGNNFKKPKRLKIRPGADAKLKKTFESIGVPDKTEFKPDPFQLKALSAIKAADCLVTAPTGAGKTWIAEKAIDRIFRQGGKSWYASPLKALTNSKHAEFSKIFGSENIGILTGDRKQNPYAPIIVGTTEILRNQLYDAMYHGRNLSADLVILDEAHFLGDVDRGVVWEEIMIYLPARIPLLLLSATIGNAKQLAGWLSSIRSKKCVIIEETKRPVPLFPLFFHPSGTLFPLTAEGEIKRKKRIYKKVLNYINKKFPPLLVSPRQLPPFGEIIRVLRKYRLLPAIFFLKSRADCDKALDICIENLLKDSYRKERIIEHINNYISKNPHIAKHRQLWHLENLALGAHHSGQLPAWKMLLESLMTEGLLEAVFATSTVAAGVNFPSRTIVLFNSDRYNGTEFLPLDPTEFHQMTGRAGRRGMDNIGFAVIVPGKFMNIRLIAKLISSSPSELLSQIKINFSMTLNLLLSHTPVQIEDLLNKSFATYLIMKKRKKGIRPKIIEYDKEYLWRDFLRHLSFLKENKYVDENNRITEDGIWASQLRIDQPLMVAEGLRLEILPKSDPALFAAIIGSFVSEQESDEKVDERLIPQKLLTSFHKVKRSLLPFAEHMINRGFEVRPLFLKPAVILYNWAAGEQWEKVVSAANMEEGILSMLIMRIADNLRQIKNLADSFPEIAATSSKAIELIIREPVEIYYESIYTVDEGGDYDGETGR